MTEEREIENREDSAEAALVRRATAGDRPALEAVIRAVQADVYNLAVRMLWSPDDAADATQDVLIKGSRIWRRSAVRALCGHGSIAWP